MTFAFTRSRLVVHASGDPAYPVSVDLVWRHADGRASEPAELMRIPAGADTELCADEHEAYVAWLVGNEGRTVYGDELEAML